MNNKRVVVDQLVAGPGVVTYTNESSMYQYMNGENIELVTRTTNVGIDYGYIQQMLSADMNFRNQIQAYITDSIKNNLNITVVPWSGEDFSCTVKMNEQVLIDKDYNARED